MKELVNTDGETQVWSAADTLAIGGVSLHVMVGRSKSELVAPRTGVLPKT
jgi:hypothetical protein